MNLFSRLRIALRPRLNDARAKQSELRDRVRASMERKRLRRGVTWFVQDPSSPACVYCGMQFKTALRRLQHQQAADPRSPCHPDCPPPIRFRRS